MGDEMTVSIIAAMSENGVIGRDGAIPWRMEDDAARFRRLVRGHHVIMGRRTYESHTVPFPKSIVVSSTMQPVVDTLVVPTVAAAIEAAAGDPFVLGGQRIFEDALPFASWVYLTLIHADVEGDTYFPFVAFDRHAWTVAGCRGYPADDRNEHPYTYVEFARRARGRSTVKIGEGVVPYRVDLEHPATRPAREPWRPSRLGGWSATAAVVREAATEQQPGEDPDE